MIFYTITDTLPVVPDWSSITGDLKAGTPISIKGAVANGEAAIGLVAGDTAHGAEYAVVVTAGVVDLNAASASYGSTVSDDVVQALDNVTFIYGGKVYAVTPSELPSVSASDNGKVLTVASGAWSAQQPSGGGAPCVVLNYDNLSGDVSCSHTASQLAAICTQYGAFDSAASGTVCAVPAVVTGDYNVAGSLWLYVGDMQSSLSSASLRAIAYVDVETVTVLDIGWSYGVWSGFYINIPLGLGDGGGMAEG